MLDKISELFDSIIEIITLCYDALVTLLDSLMELDATILTMTDNCGSSEFGNLPINKAIATYHYVVGDMIFYLTYLSILFGCLFTVYKLVMILYHKFKQMKDSFSGQQTLPLSKAGLSQLFGSFK